MFDLPISDTVLVAVINGTLTLLAGVYGEFTKNALARHHRRKEQEAESRKEQLAAVRDFLATAGELRLNSLYEALPLTYTATIQDQVKKKVEVEGSNKRLSKNLEKIFSRKPKRPAHSYSTMHEFGMDTFKIKTANAKLRAELHSAWETMDLQLAHPQVRGASKRVQEALRDKSTYVGASITSPYTKGKNYATFVASEFDRVLDELRETAVAQLRE